MKTIILNKKYELGGGIGSWAKSKETVTVTEGDTRVIGGLLMYAYRIFTPKWYESFVDGRDEVWWCPVDKELGRDYPSLRKWVNDCSE